MGVYLKYNLKITPYFLNNILHAVTCQNYDNDR